MVKTCTWALVMGLVDFYVHFCYNFFFYRFDIGALDIRLLQWCGFEFT